MTAFLIGRSLSLKYLVRFYYILGEETKLLNTQPWKTTSLNSTPLCGIVPTLSRGQNSDKLLTSPFYHVCRWGACSDAFVIRAYLMCFCVIVPGMERTASN